MPKDNEEQQKGGYSRPRRTTRRYLPPPIRYAIIASWGALVGILVFYVLNKIGS